MPRWLDLRVDPGLDCCFVCGDVFRNGKWKAGVPAVSCCLACAIDLERKTMIGRGAGHMLLRRMACEWRGADRGEGKTTQPVPWALTKFDYHLRFDCQSITTADLLTPVKGLANVATFIGPDGKTWTAIGRASNEAVPAFCRRSE